MEPNHIISAQSLTELGFSRMEAAEKLSGHAFYFKKMNDYEIHALEDTDQSYIIKVRREGNWIVPPNCKTNSQLFALIDLFSVA